MTPAIPALEPRHLIALFIVAEDDDKLGGPTWASVIRLGELAAHAAACVREGVPACKIFVYQSRKRRDAGGGLDPDNLMLRAIREIKRGAPTLQVMTEVCACAYSSLGECLLLDPEGGIDHTATHDYVGRMAALHAEAGADVIVSGLTHAGSVRAMRRALDASGFASRPVMASIQFSSAFYGPYRALMRTEPKAGNTFRSHIPPGDQKKALEWVDRFTDEGAACFTLQPIMPNIDMFIHVRAHTSLPLCAYSVSTELALGCDHERRMREDQAEVIGEYYSGLLRAGADQIMSYIAPAFAQWLNRRDTTGH